MNNTEQHAAYTPVTKCQYRKIDESVCVRNTTGLVLKFYVYIFEALVRRGLLICTLVDDTWRYKNNSHWQQQQQQS